MTPEALARIHAQAFSSTRAWSAAEFRDLLDQPGMVLTGDDRAFALLRVTLDEAEVLTVATAPEHRRKGLARAVLAQAETAVQTLGAAVIFLEVAEDNDAARALYAQALIIPGVFTFLPGRRMNALFGNGQDMAVFWAAAFFGAAVMVVIWLHPTLSRSLGGARRIPLFFGGSNR